MDPGGDNDPGAVRKPKILPRTRRPKRNSTNWSTPPPQGIYNCPKCDAVFSWKRSVSRHMEIYHPDASIPTPRLQCPVPNCSHETTRRDYLLKHIRDVHKQDPFKLLDKGPRGNGVVSSRPKQYKCLIDACDAVYVRTSHLRRHIRKYHNGDPNEVLGTKQSDGWGGSRKKGVPGGGSVQNRPLCILCCYSFYRDTTSTNRKRNLDHIRLRKFATQILHDDQESLSEILVTLERFSVCPDCLTIADSAVEGKLEVDKLELKVKELERQLETEKRKLRKRMAEYSEEMRRIEEIVSISDVACLENCLEADAAALGTSRTTRKNKQSGIKSPVLILRDGILSAAKQVEEMVPELDPTLPPSNIVEAAVLDEVPLDIVAEVPSADIYSDPLDIDIKIESSESIDVAEMEEVEEEEGGATEIEQIDSILEEFSSDSEGEDDSTAEDQGDDEDNSGRKRKSSARFQCGQCPLNNFKSQKQLESHWQRTHSSGGIDKPFKCDKCSKGFWNEQDLKTHSAAHSDQRPFSCRTGCGFALKTRQNLASHEKRCTGKMNRLVLTKWRNRNVRKDNNNSLLLCGKNDKDQ